MTVLLPEQEQEAYLNSLSPAQREKFEELRAQEPTVVRTDLLCADCGAVLELKLGRYGRFYGCANYKPTGCKGSVSAKIDGSPMGWPADAATRTLRKTLGDKLREASLYELEPWETPGGPYGHRWRYTTFCRVLGEVPGPAVFKIAEMNAQQCRRAIEAIELLVKPKRSRWDHMRLDALLEGEA